MENRITPWMTTAETAKYIKVSCDTLERWRRENSGPAYSKVENGIRYNVDVVNKWMAGE